MCELEKKTKRSKIYNKDQDILSKLYNNGVINK